MASKKAAEKTRKKTSKTQPPWARAAPRNTKHTHLTREKKAKAKAAAKRAGRRYPNLVDNMRAAT